MPAARATCACGKCSISQRVPGGMARWKCHCSHCRAINEKDPMSNGEFSFNSADWCCNVVVKGPTKGKCTTFAPCGCPCPIWCADRRQCAECGQPLVYWGHGGFTGFAIVNCATIQREMPDLEAKFENFYNSGLQKGELAPKTYCARQPALTPVSSAAADFALRHAADGDCGSTMGLFFELLCCSLPCYGTGHCCCIPWGGSSKAVAPSS